MADCADQQTNPKNIILQTIAAIPHGRVATYGQVAKLAGLPNHARYVGRILKQLPKDTQLPWHRVVSAKGIAFPEGSPGWQRQKTRLEQEGVTVIGGQIRLRQYQWQP